MDDILVFLQLDNWNNGKKLLNAKLIFCTLTKLLKILNKKWYKQLLSIEVVDMIPFV